MTSGGLGRGAGVLRSAPWLPLLGGSAAAAALLGVAVLVHGSGFAPFAALLGLAACGGAAAYVLDEESAAVLDATPTSRGRRVAWRLLLVAVPGLVALAGLLQLDHLDGATHWLRLLPFAAASLAIGVGLAAGLRRDGAAAGDLAGVLTVSVVVLLVAADPLRRWVPVLPLGAQVFGWSAIVRPTVLRAIALGVYLVLGAALTSAPQHIHFSDAQSSSSNILRGVIALFLILPAVFGDTAGGWPRRVLSLRWLGWLGLVSYGIYLWHLEVVIVLSGRVDNAGWPLLVSAIAVSTACAAASYYVVERPILRFKDLRPRGGRPRTASRSRG